MVKTSAPKPQPNRLAEANKYIFGINRENNITEGLNIYHQ